MLCGLSGCSRAAQLTFETNRDETQYREMVDGVFAALDSKNKETLKGLFAPNVIKANPGLESQMDALLEWYQGPKESDDGVDLINASTSNEYGVKEIELRNSFEIVANGVKYQVCLTMQSQNDKDKGAEGIHMLEFATEEHITANIFYGIKKQTAMPPVLMCKPLLKSAVTLSWRTLSC